MGLFQVEGSLLPLQESNPLHDFFFLFFFLFLGWGEFSTATISILASLQTECLEQALNKYFIIVHMVFLHYWAKFNFSITFLNNNKAK